MAENTDDLKEAVAFRETLLDKADARDPNPLWHGWAIVDAYLAGVKAERERCMKIAQAPIVGVPHTEYSRGQADAAIRIANEIDSRNSRPKRERRLR